MNAPQSPWYRSIVTYYPAPVPSQLTVPLLAVYGELDSQVAAGTDSAAFSELVAGGPSAIYTVTILAHVNHFFQEAVTGSPSEAAGLEPEPAPEFVEILLDWLAIQAVGK